LSKESARRKTSIDKEEYTLAYIRNIDTRQEKFNP